MKPLVVEFDESDYDLTISQARKIQADLVASGRPQRLLSEAELAEKEKERVEKRQKVSEVRFSHTLAIECC